MNPKKPYKTKQRDLILSYLDENKTQHSTATNITDYLRSRGELIGQTTVYRTLDKLVKEGVILKYTNPDGMSACYQYINADSPPLLTQYHLICNQCGEITHFQCKTLDAFSIHMYKDHKIKIDNFKTVFYGLCKTCT